MKILKSNKNLFIFYILLLFVLNILQSHYTQLIDDEAYYWMWSKNLAWGYFDHPPMVALWIKISDIFFNGSLGVRFFSALMYGFTVYLIWLLIDLKSKWQYVHEYFLLTTAVVLFSFYGFITTPDTPLFFFAALFLYAYKRFLNHDNLKTALLLGFTMAMVLYSKYQGVLILFFVVISNLKLLKNKYFWMACLLGLILFAPHILWQYNHDFPSVRYHLSREKRPYEVIFTINHFINQIIIVGLAFPVIYYAFFKSLSKKDLFSRALHFNLFGFIAFFFISTFKTGTQPQWTGLIILSLMVLSFPIIVQNNKLRRWFLILGGLNLIALIYIRIALADESLSFFRWETHNNKSWAKTLQKNTEDLPIVFNNSYQDASKYNFYTGVETDSYSSLCCRQSQYDLSNYESKIQGKTVYFVNDWKRGKYVSQKRGKIYYGKKIENFRTFTHLQCLLEQKELKVAPGESLQLTFKLINPYNKVVPLENIGYYGVFQAEKHKITAYIDLKNLLINQNPQLKSLKPLSTNVVTCTIDVPKNLKDNSKTFRIALGFYGFQGGFQGNPVTIKF